VTGVSCVLWQNDIASVNGARIVFPLLSAISSFDIETPTYVVSIADYIALAIRFA